MNVNLETEFNIHNMLKLALYILVFIQSSVLAQDNGHVDTSLVRSQLNVMVPTRDGTRLATNIFFPKAEGKYPVLISRTPYNKDNSWNDINFFVKAGYILVNQDVRGRYASEGTFVPFFNEANDGIDLFAWIINQPWSNGIIGTAGGSYLGGTQWLPAAQNPPSLKAMIPEITFSEVYEGNLYQGGAKVLHDLRWAVSILPDLISHQKSSIDNQQLPDVNKVLNGLPLADHPMIKKYAPFYGQWLSHPTAGPYWENASPKKRFEGVNVPALNISGWYDIFTWGTLQNYRSVKDKGGSALARKNQKLIMGPWTHMNTTGVFRETSFGSQSSFQAIKINDIKLKWYDRWLKDEQNGIESQDPVMIFVMGINKWRTEKDWPLPDTKYVKYYLSSNGDANSSKGDGELRTKAPTSQKSSDKYTYDPMNPVPTIGGQVILPNDNMGPKDQSAVEVREDVLVYSTPILERQLEVTGNIVLRIFVSSSAPDTDFTGKLVDVYPDGRAIILTSGIIRARYHRSNEKPSFLTPANVYQMDVNMQATSNVFLPGHRLRLEVSSSNFPQYNRNSNTGGDMSKEEASDYRSAVNTVFHEKAHPSHLILPIIERD